METALKKLPDDCKVTIDWKPFFLNPNAPSPGVDKLKMYHEKFGKDRVEKMIPYMKEQGEKVGIKFSYGGKVGNTLSSHRLVEFAKSKGKQDAMIEKIMSYYFEQEKDISDTKVLEAAASEVGLDAKEVLSSDTYTDKVKGEVHDAYRMGISGVPAFVINKKYSLSGAQDTESWEGILKKLGYLK
mmetsp:Transcript_26396/g.63672  ORF Transcript_26396/g.63672 Transcript_26396/m.63672 type:complete len:185 (-) Transcript_26396:238-792(-)|eukprot:CAMPEP_0114499734 /NCGR_PEP_ID=MMETSP0109-20121206/7581_1 /TAXON_ID=29199 /ORGANISM="Chlorarachnion reptans, Strain CCCM449" /LENGTH=184 /DNA_ID=CAMNT_0001677333 /DNA_START=201 /DNA_END=755 /DNA_ORIENTATION=+